MHVSSLFVDLHWLLQFVFTPLVLALGLRYLLKNTASKYFVVDANSDPIGTSSCFLSSSPSSSSSSSSFSCSSSSSSSSSSCSSGQTSSGASLMPGVIGKVGCAKCGSPATNQCSRCKAVKYCTLSCQTTHWADGHKKECKVSSHKIALLPSGGSVKKQVDKILFPYDEFVKLFNWHKPGLRPCGLMNCGNSCFANVVLQCLTHTRPLVAYLMDKNHRRECRRNEWCFLCELQSHLERAGHQQPFSPLTILSRLPSLGGNLGYGKQEDAHEFMRFAIDTMQSAFLDEHGGEKLIHPQSQETTLIQHIFGGQLQSQVICTQCNQVSNQYENMMDLTVEIQGDAASLEECLDQFTVKEWLDGDNMYKCDGCNGYVKAWKRLAIRQAPNILTITLKRFQSGRFGKLNKKITFPENLNVSPYMSEGGDYTDKYKLYAVVVHVDMLNASFFGHYICYIKDFQGTWYRIDDCKVVRVELDDVLSQGAYMLLYSRVVARATCLKTFEAPNKQEELLKSASIGAEQCCPRKQNNSTVVEQTVCSTGSVAAGEFASHSNNSVLKTDQTCLLVSRDVQDDGLYTEAISIPIQHTNIETSSFISPPIEGHTITSETLTNGVHGESGFSEGNAPFSSSTSINSSASEDISSENNLPTSSLTKSYDAEKYGSPLNQDAVSAASKINENGITFSGPYGHSNSVIARQSESEICKSITDDDAEINGTIIPDLIVPENVSSESARCPNDSYDKCADLDPLSRSATTQQSEPDTCTNKTDDISQQSDSDVSRESKRCRSDENCSKFDDLDCLDISDSAQQSESELCQNQMEYDVEISDHIILDQIAPEKESREPERCESDMDVDGVKANAFSNLANGNHIPDQNGYASSINNGLDEQSSSQKEPSSTFQIDMEIDDNRVNENASSNGDESSHQSQGLPVNGGPLYTSNKQLLGQNLSPGAMESGAAR